MILEESLKPDFVFNKMTDVPFAQMYEDGFRFALLDMDNTIVEDHAEKPTSYTHEVMDILKKYQFTPCIVSNAKSSRSENFAKELGISYVSYAQKPSPKGIYRAMEMMGAKPEESVFFGDQLFTDIMAAKRAGIRAVFIEPYQKKEVFYVRLKRPAEWLIRNLLRF